MREQLVPDGQSQERSCPAAITEISSVMLGDTRRLIFVSAGLLCGCLAGAAAVVSVLLGRGDDLALGAAGLILPVIVSWLAAATLMILAEQPVAVAFGELRRATGVPVDPSAPWLPAGVKPLAASELEWDLVVPFTAAASVQHGRARLALVWAVITTAGFLLWMALSLAIAAAA